MRTPAWALLEAMLSRLHAAGVNFDELWFKWQTPKGFSETDVAPKTLMIHALGAGETAIVDFLTLKGFCAGVKDDSGEPAWQKDHAPSPLSQVGPTPICCLAPMPLFCNRE